MAKQKIIRGQGFEFKVVNAVPDGEFKIYPLRGLTGRRKHYIYIVTKQTNWQDLEKFAIPVEDGYIVLERVWCGDSTISSLEAMISEIESTQNHYAMEDLPQYKKALQILQNVEGAERLVE